MCKKKKKYLFYNQHEIIESKIIIKKDKLSKTKENKSIPKSIDKSFNQIISRF